MQSVYPTFRLSMGPMEIAYRTLTGTLRENGTGWGSYAFAAGAHLTEANESGLLSELSRCAPLLCAGDSVAALSIRTLHSHSLLARYTRTLCSSPSLARFARRAILAARYSPRARHATRAHALARGARSPRAARRAADVHTAPYTPRSPCYNVLAPRPRAGGG
eukprot:469347-Prymnesium_polylepis.1